jgi:hypothetical protein
MVRRKAEPREFVWARADGIISDDDAGLASGVDLLAEVRGRHGTAAMRGATVMVVKGYLMPAFGLSDGNDWAAAGRASIGVRSYADLDTADLASEGPVQDPEAKWMGYFPFRQEGVGSSPSQTAHTVASWSPGNDWSVNLQSHRKMGSLGTTLVLYCGTLDQTSANVTIYWNFDLSIGVKLA